jgi:pyruvate-formate lyase-activating enzyme
MKRIEHKNNNPWWQAKVGDATAEQVAEFAKVYQKAEAGARPVTVTEGVDWVGADHIRRVVDHTRAEGAVCVWVSDGTFAQVVWRASEATK